MKVLKCFAVLCVLIPNFILAGEFDVKRGTGLATSFQDNQLDIVLPIWTGAQVVTAPSLGVVYAQDIGSEITAGLTLRFYSEIKRVTPYKGVRFGAFFSSPKEGEHTTDVFVGLLYGGEFFLASQFSFGIEAQANLTKSGKNSTRFGNPGGINVNTAAAIIANVYF